MYEHPERLLEPYAAMLSEFGRKHGFRQDRFRHDMPVWTFIFPHPSGDTGRVSVQVNEKRDVFVVKYWPGGKAKGKESEIVKVDNAAQNLESVLASAVDEIMSWRA